MLETILPQLAIPYWTFDPQREEDIVLGKKLWASVVPAVRSLRVVLQNACVLAHTQGKKRITPDLVKQGYAITMMQRRSRGIEEDESEEEKQESQTEYENKSVRRQKDKKQPEEE